ncbi:MAG TPA: hypothetical protein VF222_11065 [Nitrososphaeraceae archaeon]|nr:hypothetical protein [Nitrososphaeraceae archaeon]
MANSESKPVDDLSNRSLKKIGEIDPKLFESNNEKEIEVRSWKKQKSETWHIYLDTNTGHLRKWKSSSS